MRKHMPGCPCCGGPGDGTIGIPDCDCTPIPINLTMDDLSGGVPGYAEVAGAYAHGLSPASLPGGGPTNKDWWIKSTIYNDGFPAGNPDNDYQWTVSCNDTFFVLGNFYPTLSGGTWFQAGLYAWSLVAAGNSCSPFDLPNGFDAGSIPRTYLRLHG